MSTPWRSDLAALVARALQESGHAEVESALAEHVAALSQHPDAPVEPFRPAEPLLALLPCEAGFLGVLAHTDGHVSVHVARTTTALLDQVRENVDHAVVLEGIPPVADETRESLAGAGLAVPAWFSGSGFTEDELLAACAAVLAA